MASLEDSLSCTRSCPRQTHFFLQFFRHRPLCHFSLLQAGHDLSYRNYTTKTEESPNIATQYWPCYSRRAFRCWYLDRYIGINEGETNNKARGIVNSKGPKFFCHTFALFTFELVPFKMQGSMSISINGWRGMTDQMSKNSIVVEARMCTLHWSSLCHDLRGLFGFSWFRTLPSRLIR